MTASAEGYDALNQAKRPKTALAGSYGHPVHPIVVTIPIGAWTASLLFDIGAWLSPTRAATLEFGAYWLVIIGIVGALLAATFGFIDLMNIPRTTRTYRTGLVHMSLNLTVSALFLVNAGIRYGTGVETRSVAGIVLTLIALVILSASGYLGGKLSYRYGVRVAGEGTQLEGYR